jgi:hypothetical protein
LPWESSIYARRPLFPVKAEHVELIINILMGNFQKTSGKEFFCVMNFTVRNALRTRGIKQPGIAVSDTGSNYFPDCLLGKIILDQI